MKCIGENCDKEIEVKFPGFADQMICMECFEKDPSYVVYGKVDMEGNIEEVPLGENMLTQKIRGIKK